MSALRAATCVASLVVLAAVTACGAGGSAPPTPNSARATPAPRSARFEDALDGRPELLVAIRPRALARDGVYGPLLRRASEIAAARAGVRNVGTTALAAFERADEVVVAASERGRVAVVVLRGVPQELDAAQLIDTDGRALWRAVGDVRPGILEFAPAAGGEGGALFVLPERTWVIAIGEASTRAREALLRSTGASPFALDPPLAAGALASLALRGDTLVRWDGRLRSGPLAAVGRTLDEVTLALSPGTQGVVVATLTYGDRDAAGAAESRIRDVVAAFRRKLTRSPSAAGMRDGGVEEDTDPPAETSGSSLDWLAAAGVERDGAVVTVRAPIPGPWLSEIARADVHVFE